VCLKPLGHLSPSAIRPAGAVGRSYSAVAGRGNGIFPPQRELARLRRIFGGKMVLFRALGWALLAAAVAAVVNDCLAWWSEGAFRLLSLGELWGRVGPGSLHHAQGWLEGVLAGRPWRYLAQPLLKLPALPVFVAGGLFLLWLGRRSIGRPEAHFISGSRPRRRRHRSLS
jgi:hypothetical protein